MKLCLPTDLFAQCLGRSTYISGITQFSGIHTRSLKSLGTEISTEYGTIHPTYLHYFFSEFVKNFTRHFGTFGMHWDCISENPAHYRFL